MQSSRFSTVLIAALSVALGVAASSSPAIGYPAGAAISLGSNPVRSAAGELSIPSDTSTGTILSSSADASMVITDILVGFFQKANHCRGSGIARVVGSDGVTYANLPIYITTLGNSSSHVSQISTQSGFVVPAGTSLSIEWGWGWRECGESYYTLAYNVSGYLVAP